MGSGEGVHRGKGATGNGVTIIHLLLPPPSLGLRVEVMTALTLFTTLLLFKVGRGEHGMAEE